MGKLVCIGGGTAPELRNTRGWKYKTKEIDEEIVKLSGKKNPKLIYIGTGNIDSFEAHNIIKKIYNKLGCDVNNLILLEENLDINEIKNKILNSDIIYIGHGFTNFMLRIRRQLGVDKILIEAYNKGIVCCGSSAGSYCWFKMNYSKIQGLGVINAINCVHYETKNERAKEKFYNLIKETGLDGIAIENYVALEILDGKFKVIKSDPTKNAYKINYKNNKFIEKNL